jgi:uncharacterized coiled-coil protein SlyX
MKIQTKSVHPTFIIMLLLACFALSPSVQAVVPAPDGGYPGGNTAEGQNAFLSLTTGGFNTGVGFFSLSSDTTGSFNTAIGAGALALNTADSNTAIGAAALLNNTVAQGNTAIGASALVNNVFGAGNTAIGAGTLPGLTTGCCNIDIDSPGVQGEDHTTRIGQVQTRTFIAGVHGVQTINAAIPVLVDFAGQLGTLSSSKRFKKEIKPMDRVSEGILALKPVTFHYKNETTSTPQFGLIAEEVAEVNPDLVVRDKNGEIYTVRYDAVNAMLLNEFLKEHRRVEAQDCKLRGQEATIAELESTVARQQKEFQTAMAEQRKEMASVLGRLKEQDATIQTVRAQLELNRRTPRTVSNGQ